MANVNIKVITRTGKKKANSPNGLTRVKKLPRVNMNEIANRALGNAGTVRARFKKRFNMLMGRFMAFALFTTETVSLKQS
mgnify:CR=1 FL=1